MARLCKPEPLFGRESGGWLAPRAPKTPVRRLQPFFATYKLRVFRLLSNADNAGYKSFSIQAFQEATNDDCTSAETISVITTSATTVNFEIAGADINNEVGCSGITNDYADIWYEFTMPVNGNVFVSGSISWNICLSRMKFSTGVKFKVLG